MPKSKGNGGKKKRRGANAPTRVRKLVYANDDEDYAKVGKLLGERRCSVICMKHRDRDNVIGHIRGKMAKREWVRIGDWVLVSYRNTVEKCRTVDIIKRYNEFEVSQLKSDGLVKEPNQSKAEEEYEIINIDGDEDDAFKPYTNDPYGEIDKSSDRVHAIFEDDQNDKSEDESDDNTDTVFKKKSPHEFEDIGDYYIDDI